MIRMAKFVAKRAFCRLVTMRLKQRM